LVNPRLERIVRHDLAKRGVSVPVKTTTQPPPKTIDVELEERTIGKTEIKPSEPKKTQWTKTEWHSLTSKWHRESRLDLLRLYRERLEIKPTVTYIYTHPESGMETHLLGTHIRSMYYDPAIKQARESYKQSFETKLGAMRLDPRATVVKTEKGEYEVHMPESSQLDWSKYYMEKTKDLGVGVSEAGRFGFGVTSSIFALGRPVAGMLGFGEQFDIMTTVGMSATVAHPAYFGEKKFLETLSTGVGKIRYGVHYVSPFDIAFEPAGWSPKGSSEFVRSDPWFAAGGVVGEVGIGYMAGQALKPVGAGVKIGAKTIVSKTPTIYSRLSYQFPKIFAKGWVTESGRLVGTTPAGRLFHKISETGFARNIYGWAAKGCSYSDLLS